MACGPRAVLSHVSAAVHWNLLQYEPARPEVTAPASRQGVPGIRLHRSHSLDAQDTTNHQGIPTTTVHRTLLDIAAQAPQHHLERALAQAERLQLYDHRAITETIARANGHRGTKTLTKAIAGDPQFTRGELEALMNKLARDHGLPQPESNYTLDVPDHPGLEADFYFPALPPGHRDRRLGHPPHPPRLRSRPRQGRRADRRRLHRRSLHLPPVARRPADRRRPHQGHHRRPLQRRRQRLPKLRELRVLDRVAVLGPRIAP